MHSRNHLNPWSLAVAGIALASWLMPASIAAQSRQSGKPGSRTSAAPRAQAPSGRTATPRAAAPRTSSGGQQAARAPQRSGDTSRRADANSRAGGQQVQGRDRGDRPADGVAVARGSRGTDHPRSPHYRYPYYAYGYPYGYSYAYGYRYSPYDAYLYDPFFWGYPGMGLGYSIGGYSTGGYSTYESYGQSHGRGYSTFDEGGLRLKVKPRSADVLVDGYFAGKVDDFDGVFQKLKLEAGPHRIEIRQDGYQPLSFEVRIPSDDTITYEGDLEPTTR